MPWVCIEPRKAGFLGYGNIISLVESIKMIVDIDGRSDGSACVHKNPTWMHLKACSLSLQLSIISGSIMSAIIPRLYNPHACMYDHNRASN